MSDPAVPRLLSYIAPAAPATRRPARGDEPFLRPEVGFTVRWYREALDLDFGERWHNDPAYRCDTLVHIGGELRRRFPGADIGRLVDPEDPEAPPDVLTGVFGGCFVAGLYGMPIRYAPDNWPATEHRYLASRDVDSLEPPDLDRSPMFAMLMEQVDWIEENCGRVAGYVSWQGVLNNAFRLRGEEVFIDMALHPERARHLFECVAETMIGGMRRLYERQRRSGVEIGHCTVSNCLVNMVSPGQYRELLLPFDRGIADAFGLIGIHNCAWDATPYLEAYAEIPRCGYIDMGLGSDLDRAKELFPDARRALMYTPMDLAAKPLDEIRRDFERIAADYGPCDIVLADIEAGTPDDRVRFALDLCAGISEGKGDGSHFSQRG